MSEKQTVLSANNFNNEKNYYDGYELLQSSTYFYLVRLLHSGRFVLVYDCLILCFLSYFVSVFMPYLRLYAIAYVPIQEYLLEKNSLPNKIYTYRKIGTFYCWQTASTTQFFSDVKHMSLRVTRRTFELPVTKSKLSSYPWYLPVPYLQNFAGNKGSLPCGILQNTPVKSHLTCYESKARYIKKTVPEKNRNLPEKIL